MVVQSRRGSMSLPEEETQGHEKSKFSWGRSLAATALASVALNAALGLPKMVEVERGEQADEAAALTVGPSSIESGEGVAAEAAETEEVMLERWARQFSADRQAGELVDPTELEKVPAAIKHLLQSGFSVDRLTIQGFASDEDDSVDQFGQRTGGLQLPNPKNVELAEKRADLYTFLLADRLQEEGMKLPQTEVLGGVEDYLSDQETSQIEALAGQFGYGTSLNMIETFNRQPDSVPPEVEQYLNSVLYNRRKVEVKIYFSRALGTGEASEQTDALLDTSEQSQQHDVELPLFLVIPIPLRKRRREAEPNGDSPVNQPVLTSESMIDSSQATNQPAQKPADSRGSVAASEPFVPRIPKDALSQEPWRQDGLVTKSQTGQLQKQPRNQNFHKDGRMGRSSGGDRRGRRG
jgi:hypothetical protein